jgi:trk system potassium uptake protein TrkH
LNRVQIRAAIHVSAFFAMYLAAAMILPAGLDLYFGNPDWKVFALSALLVGGLSILVIFATDGRPPPVSPRFGFLLVNSLWITLALTGAIPLMLSSLQMSFTDAFFESVSGITTTGSTVINGLDHAPPGLLLWRSLLNFVGGLGVIAFGLFLLPFLNVGGVSYFRIESSDIEDRPFARFRTFTLGLIVIYTMLVILCAIAYSAAGMSLLNAINHAMATLATGGFSPHDTSFARYADNYWIMWIATVFMFIGGLPFSILILFVVRGRLDALGDPQIKVYLGYTVIFIITVAVYLRVADNVPFFAALTQSAFNLTSIITTTGFASGDYTLWGPFAVSAIFLAMFVGGCSGSTTGGIKSYRLLILFELLAAGLHRLVYPNSVFPIRYGERTIDADMQRAVVLFIASFFVLWGLITVGLAATGLDLVTALTGSLTALTNVGPGLGTIIGPVGNFSSLPDLAKWLCTIGMLLGRLEILAVLVVLTPVFWRG